MRRVRATDIGAVTQLYQEAINHACRVGTIDWPNPVPHSFIDGLLSGGELYCFDSQNDKSALCAAVKLAYTPDSRIWRDDVSAVYISKLATSDAVRGQNFVRSILLPAVAQRMDTRAVLRLDCLAHNSRLRQFYTNLGFVDQGDVTFYSDKQQRNLTVTRFEMKSSDLMHRRGKM